MRWKTRSWSRCAIRAERLPKEGASDENVGSAKSIVKNVGILENEYVHTDGKIVQRDWISLGGT